ncbi:hypothetical protein K5D56_10520 [Pseudomonas cichorii]|uniref:Uncharacterized protein n=1 Tax=Pseudomonas lijiangensis TaxID=2995658 RepID=A0ABX8HMY7_9PSED|nr:MULTISPECIES: hypothetical protein [Pseudomonas syringae group]MBX8499684.1 hypothetical protein [Pseudomonas lijiangensis]MBX8505196.1 hypothetical protein [Pseudomonas lijiangensis]MBX8519683.1 hypothetical protein [Pseudomonas cichorii]MBX8540608.1 hypothetical protein [Pseudomonas cichorii]MBX8567094.1 hypothetical protein [Pseudomonas cichorii]
MAGLSNPIARSEQTSPQPYRSNHFEGGSLLATSTDTEYLPVTDPFASKLPPTRFVYALTDRHYFITADFKLPETRKPLQRGFLQRSIKPGYQVI